MKVEFRLLLVKEGEKEGIQLQREKGRNEGIERRKVDILCVQETGWKRSNAYRFGAGSSRFIMVWICGEGNSDDVKNRRGSNCGICQKNGNSSGGQIFFLEK